VPAPLPAFPAYDLTGFDLVPAGRSAATAAREVTYVTVGLGVLTIQRLQVRRRELERSLRRRTAAS
jgi:hypothetical protein